MNQQMPLVLLGIRANVSKQTVLSAETLLRSFLEAQVYLATRRIPKTRSKTLPPGLHRARRSLEKNADGLRMPKPDRGTFLVREGEPRRIALKPLPKLAEDIEGKMVTLPFQSERHDDFALLRLVLGMPSVFSSKIGIRSFTQDDGRADAGTSPWRAPTR